MAVRVLLAEDNESLALVLKRFLAGQGLDVVTARNGLEALQVLSGERIDLLVLDLKLPVMSGGDLLQKLRTSPRFAALPIIIMTGVYKGPHHAEAARRLGVRHYLEKPFTQGLFLETVRKALGEVPGERKPALFDLLVDIYNKGASGLLSVNDGPLVCFINGEPVSFLSRKREDFPAYLVGRGKIGLSDLRQFVACGEERIFLTQTGLLPYEELLEESRLFLVKSLMDALAASAPAEFTAGRPDAPPSGTPLSPWPDV